MTACSSPYNVNVWPVMSLIVEVIHQNDDSVEHRNDRHAREYNTMENANLERWINAQALILTKDRFTKLESLGYCQSSADADEHPPATAGVLTRASPPLRSGYCPLGCAPANAGGTDSAGKMPALPAGKDAHAPRVSRCPRSQQCSHKSDLSSTYVIWV